MSSLPAIMKKIESKMKPQLFSHYILSTKRNAMFLFAFFGVGFGFDFKNVLIQWFCLTIKTLMAYFRHKLDTMLCLESKIL